MTLGRSWDWISGGGGGGVVAWSEAIDCGFLAVWERGDSRGSERESLLVWQRNVIWGIRLITENREKRKRKKDALGGVFYSGVLLLFFWL